MHSLKSYFSAENTLMNIIYHKHNKANIVTSTIDRSDPNLLIIFLIHFKIGCGWWERERKENVCRICVSKCVMISNELNKLSKILV